MQDKLRAAFSRKEKAEMFLANLEKLKEEKGIGEAQYRVLKIEYTHMCDNAVSEINTVKNTIRKEIDNRTSKLEFLKHELSYLEARFKVGQLSLDNYLAKERGPKKQAMELESRISEFKSFLKATSSAEFGVAREDGFKMLGVKLGLSKKQSSEEMSPVSPLASAAGQIVAPVDKQTPLPPLPPPPPEPLPPPPPPPPVIRITDLQIMPSRVMESGSVGIIVTVTNIVMWNVRQRVELKINDEVRDSREVNLFPGESQEITFVASAEKPGNYLVNINGITGVFTVVAAENVRYLR